LPPTASRRKTIEAFYGHSFIATNGAISGRIRRGGNRALVATLDLALPRATAPAWASSAIAARNSYAPGAGYLIARWLAAAPPHQYLIALGSNAMRATVPGPGAAGGGARSTMRAWR
jgi:hypothetical protein